MKRTENASCSNCLRVICWMRKWCRWSTIAVLFGVFGQRFLLVCVCVCVLVFCLVLLVFFLGLCSEMKEVKSSFLSPMSCFLSLFGLVEFLEL